MLVKGSECDMIIVPLQVYREIVHEAARLRPCLDPLTEGLKYCAIAYTKELLKCISVIPAL